MGPIVWNQYLFPGGKNGASRKSRAVQSLSSGMSTEANADVDP